MVAIKLPLFAGMVPSIDPHLLTDKNAEYARDAWLYSGALVGLPKRAELHTLANPAAAIAFRIPNNMGDPSYLYDSFWVEFENADTDFISAPVAADQYRRYYWTSTSQVPMYNTEDRMRAGQPAFLLGLPSPGAMTVTSAGGSSSTLVTRAYIATLVTDYGEEGPANAAVTISGKLDDTYTVTVPGVAAVDLGVQRNVKKIRIYRTIVSAAGTATYYQVAEITATTSAHVYNDTLSDGVLATRPLLESTAWTAPPSLDGMATMPNGIVAGYKGNELFFSEPYRPHAWPAAYSLMLDYDIVGLAAINQTLVVCTKGNPVTASGVNPAAITTATLAAFEPCLSKGSILATEAGVYYTSPNGIILVNAGYAQNVTRQFITRDKWNAVVNRGRVNAARMGSAYYAFGAGVQRAAQVNAFQSDMIQTETSDGAAEGFMLDPSSENSGFVYLTDTAAIKSVYNDDMSGEVLIVLGGKVYWLDQRPGFSSRDYKWKSKIFQTSDNRNFAAMKVFFYDPPSFTPPNPRNNAIDQVFDPNTQYGLVRVYADGRHIATREIRENGEILRLPSGFKADFWQIEIEAVVKVKNFQMATTAKELAGV